MPKFVLQWMENAMRKGSFCRVNNSILCSVWFEPIPLLPKTKEIYKSFSHSYHKRKVFVALFNYNSLPFTFIEWAIKVDIVYQLYGLITSWYMTQFYPVRLICIFYWQRYFYQFWILPFKGSVRSRYCACLSCLTVLRGWP
jgi:hypothetical protein